MEVTLNEVAGEGHLEEASCDLRPMNEGASW